LDLRGTNEQDAGENCITRSFIICTSSPDIVRMVKSRKTRWAGHIARNERKRAYEALVRNPEGKRSLGIPRRKWEDNIKLDLKEMLCEDVDWIHTAQDRDQWRAVVSR
jgi:hypothetical protein